MHWAVNAHSAALYFISLVYLIDSCVFACVLFADEVAVVVADFGREVSKLGFAGQDCPRWVSRTVRFTSNDTLSYGMACLHRGSGVL